MLPASLKGVYQQYKDDTKLVATWLASTAKANGYELASGASSKPENPAGTSTRLKGKARKQAKAAASQQAKTGAATSSQTPSKKTQYVLQIKEFEPMAAFLANIKSVKVPDYFAVAIERVIWVRKSFSETLVSTDLASDKRHTFFVSVLEKVRDCLKPLTEAGVFNMDELKKATESSTRSKDPVHNMFGILGVYEPSDAFLNAPDVVLQTSEVEYVVEQDRSLHEIIFAFSALLNDYECLRNEIKSLWTKCAAGELDLAAVSVATNAAFELARDMEAEVRPIVDTYGNLDEFLGAYLGGLCSSMDIDLEEKEQMSDPYNLEAYPLAQVCLFNTIRTLIAYYNAHRGGIAVTNYNGMFGWYDTKLGGKGRTNRIKSQQDMAALMEVLPDLHFLSASIGRGMVEDELIRGIGDMLEMKKPLDLPFWYAWSMQVFLDILQNFGDVCDRGWLEMRQESLRIKKSMLDVPSSKERNEVLNVVTAWDKDPMKDARDQMIELGVLEGSGSPNFRFLHRNPMYCGLWIHKMRTTLHDYGVHYAATPGALMCTTQLYQALQQEKLLGDRVWDDLETFWKMQGNSSFFVGDPPTNREAYFRNYCISLGASVSNWAPTKRKGKVPQGNAANRRNMKFMGRLSLLMSRRLQPTGDRTPLTSQAVGELLAEGRRYGTMDGKGHVQPSLEDKAKQKASHHQLIVRSITNIPQPSLVDTTPTGLIRDLAGEIQADIPDISFNYFTMHNTAWSLLKTLKEEFTKVYGTEFMQYVPQEGMLPFVVGYVFSTAAGQKGANEKGKPSDILLLTAAKTLCEFLEDGRGRVIRDAPKVKPADVAGLQFDRRDQWGMDKMLRQVRKMASDEGMDGQCPMQ